MSMIINPKIKFMDEPSTGLDPIARNFYNFLNFWFLGRIFYF